MTSLITPEEHLSETAELLQSLHDAVRRVRQQAEILLRELEDEGEDGELGHAGKQVTGVEGLIRACHKVEASLVEQYDRQAGIVQGGYALDLERARTEIGSRIARLRACRDDEGVPE